MKAVIWSKDNCQFCIKAKTLLDIKGVPYEERKIGAGWTKEQLLEAVPTARTVPQIFVDSAYVGGFDQLQKYFE